MSIEHLGRPPRFFTGFDKLTHCGLFFVLAILFCINYLKRHNSNYLPLRPAFFITIAIILYGGVIELLQEYIFTWRSGDWWDLFADSVGVFMGLFSVLLTTVAVKNVKA